LRAFRASGGGSGRTAPMRTLRMLPVLAALAALPAVRAEEEKAYAVGDKVELAKLERVTGGDAVDLAAALEKSKRGLVLVWYSPTCPWCFKFSKQYAALRKKYEAKGNRQTLAGNSAPMPNARVLPRP